jgi:CubicO group peptidase (beta-lactamase class C family)
MKIRRDIVAWLAAIGIAGAPLTAPAQVLPSPAQAGMSTERLARVSAVDEQYVADGAIAGAVTMVHRKGHLAHVSVSGYQDLATKTPMRRDTIFALASMTKPITAVAAMILVEDGRLRLDDPVDRWLPELANRQVLVDPAGPLSNVRPSPRPITLRDLLTYRMGIGVVGYAGLAEDSPIGKAFAEVSTTGVTGDEYMAKLGALPLVYVPGERFMYNTPSSVLGVLVARVSGMSFDRFLESRIFRPLGMTDTAFFVPADKRARLATVYAPGPDGALVPTSRQAPSEAPAFPSASGGLYSTADDYTKFARMMLGKGMLGSVRILSRPSVELMTRDFLTKEAPDSYFITKNFFDAAGFGFGLQVLKEQTGLGPSPGSFWWQGATGVTWSADPREELIIVRLIQRMGPPPTYPPDSDVAVYQAIDD